MPFNEVLGSQSGASAATGRLSQLPNSREKVVSLAPQEPGRQLDGRGHLTGQRDWTSAVSLIQEAHEAMRINQNRILDLEAQLREVVSQAEQEIHGLREQIDTNEYQLALAQEQIRSAETRATDAEAWLQRLHDTIVSTFSPLLSAGQSARDSGTAA